jgi:hypothetical protein
MDVGKNLLRVISEMSFASFRPCLRQAGESSEGILLGPESRAFAFWIPAFAAMTIRFEFCLKQTEVPCTPIL